MLRLVLGASTGRPTVRMTEEARAPVSCSDCCVTASTKSVAWFTQPGGGLSPFGGRFLLFCGVVGGEGRAAEGRACGRRSGEKGHRGVDAVP